MAADNARFVKTTHTGWFSRVKSALGGLIVGPIIIFGSGYLLTWNEGHSAKMIEALTQGRREVVTVASDRVDPAMEGKLVYLTGRATTDEVLEDALFGVSKNALSLRRDSEMYQWREEKDERTEKQVGGGETTTVTYTYQKGWSSSLTRSSNFGQPEGHTNPAEFRFPSETFVAKDATLGIFRLDKELVTKVSDAAPIVLAPSHVVASVQGAKVLDGGVYIGADSAQPAVGDMRIRFSAVAPQVVSIVGAQRGGTLAFFQAQNGVYIGLVSSGVRTAQELFDAELQLNTLITWGIRLLGLFLMFLGFAITLSLFSVLADVVPFIGGVVQFGTNLIAFLCALAVWAATIAIAWFAYRPVHAAILIAAVLGIAAWVYTRRSKKVAGLGKAA
jgi:hypothetical protein